MLIFYLLIALSLSQQCSDYLYDQSGCVLSSGYPCRWNSFTSQCMDSSATNLGCSNVLNQLACIQQIDYPDGTQASCMFSGYCRDVDTPLKCSQNLSRAACLSTKAIRCRWNVLCQTVEESELNSIYTNLEQLKLSSIMICASVPSYMSVHIKAVKTVLSTLYRASLLKGDSSATKYKTLSQIPGCLISLDQSIIDTLTCDAIGVNLLTCLAISKYSCIFKNGVCQTPTDLLSLECSMQLNRLACLSVTNIAQPCYWANSRCNLATLSQSTTCAAFTYQVSPSYCQAITNSECFYDQATFGCHQKCRLVASQLNQTLCRQSTYDCKWENNTCKFNQASQCGILGQNRLACMNAEEKCNFVNGQCLKITLLSLLRCTDGLNREACLKLDNPSQSCIYDQQCKELLVTPATRCFSLTVVNANACRKVTTEACYYSIDSCALATGAQACTTEGFNKLACMSTTSSVSACKWDIERGTCTSLTIERTTQCGELQLVNAVACRNVQYRVGGVEQLCQYDETIYQCMVLVMSSTVTCAQSGLNKASCVAISNSALPCRWLSGQCIQVQGSLGAAVTCTALQNVTSKTCALATANNQKCRYEASRTSCATSVQPGMACSTSGLNTYGCAFLTASCYYDLTSMSCVATTVTLLGTLNCATNFPSKSACLAITKAGQYCVWSAIDSFCQAQEFPTNKTCVSFTLSNRLTCLAYESNVTHLIESNYYCTYTTACSVYAGTLTGCGSGTSINLHGCVALSDVTKECYFNNSNLTCTEVTDTNIYNTLTCKQANAKLCPKIRTPLQLCKWLSDAYEKKCYPITVDGTCTSYVNVNMNVCSQVTLNNEKCAFNSGTSSCAVSAGSTQTCATPGLNKKACIESTQEACYYDMSTMTCTLITNTNAKQVRCSDQVNQKGCLASQKEACVWSSGVCSIVTSKDFTTVTCTALVDQLYNPIVCGKVTTADEYCTYDTATSTCLSNSFVTDCAAGYNQVNCSAYNQCDWDPNSYLCSTKTVQSSNQCTQAADLNACMAITTLPCIFLTTGNKCQQLNVSTSTTCTQYQGANKYNAAACQSITKTGQVCIYDTTNKQCLSSASTTLACTTAGLNKQGCMLNTTGYCQFDSNLSSGTPGCTTIADITQKSCSSELSLNSCVNVPSSKGICTFDKSTMFCSEIYVVTATCSASQNSSVTVFSSAYCMYTTGTACQYNATTRVCQNATTVATCTADSSLNELACLNNVSNATCSFYYPCTAMDSNTLKELTCSQALSFRQCVGSGSQACKWNGSSCGSAAINVTCNTLTSINSLACMQNVNGTEKCQFLDSGLTTSCVVPANDIQACSGLNQVACIANTANPCYYKTKCVDISLEPYDAECQPGFYFTQSACTRIQNPGQTCQWNGSNCISIYVDINDTCGQYSASTNNPQICANIATGNCYWNNGCVTGVATTCASGSATLGPNKGACINALAGSCIFTNYRCLDVLVDSVTSSQCTDPANRLGCLNLNNGKACRWSSGACSALSTVSGTCTSYTDVNPSTCAQTIDVACQWTANNCAQVVTTGLACSAKGLNKSACLTKTTGFCFYDGLLCTTLTQTQLDLKACTANLSQGACLGKNTACCQWTNNACVAATVGGSCATISNYSKYCCSQVTGSKCTYAGTCNTLMSQTGKCETASNKAGCQWLTQKCQWSTSCQPINDSFLGCLSSISNGACIKQFNFCMFVTECVTGALTSCTQLGNSSQPSQCAYVTDVGCQSWASGCVVSAYNVACNQANLNKLGCIDTTNECYWDTATTSCKNNAPAAPGSVATTCPTTIASRGTCSTVSNCRIDTFSCVAYAIDFKTSCDFLNSEKASTNCLQIQSGPCAYDSTKKKCTSIVSATTCTQVPVNELGCRYVSANCTWTSSTCTASTTTYYVCSNIFTKYSCYTNLQTACTWDSTTHKCVDYTGVKNNCTALTATQTSPGVCYYFSLDFCQYNGVTCQLQAAQTTCALAQSPRGCQAVANKNCYWDQRLATCIEIVNLTAVESMTCTQLEYTKKALCIMTTLEGQTCNWNGFFCVAAVASEVSCSSDLSINGCIAVAKPGEKCKFINGSCTYDTSSTSKCSNNINIYACTAVSTEGQYCKWLGQRCKDISTLDGYVASAHILINQNVCIKAQTSGGQPLATLDSISYKYSPTQFICVVSDPTTDTCSTPGLNYYGCLRTLVDACDWTGSKCIPFVKLSTYQKCSDYQTVSPKVCADITLSGIRCRYNTVTLSCENAGNDKCTTFGLNKAACLNVMVESCIWKVDHCESISVVTGYTNCMELVNVSPMACASVDIEQKVCRYNTATSSCSIVFDASYDNCDTVGLNSLGCSQVQRGKCIFIQGICQFYTRNEQLCSNLVNVNANVCKSLDVVNQPCKFSSIIRSCSVVHSDDICNTLGINKQGCVAYKNEQTCLWLQDTQTCTCAGVAILNGMRDCSSLTVAQCTAQQCIVGSDNKCRLKQCSDNNKSNCDGQVVNQQSCYILGSLCAGATQCNQIIGASDCTKIRINDKFCAVDLNNADHCVDAGCQHKLQPDCIGTCLWNARCMDKQCTQLSQSECVGVYQNQQCYWQNNHCYGLQSCQEYASLRDITNVKSDCESYTMFGKSCKWQLSKPYSTTYECSSTLCSHIGSSSANCHGAELKGEVCVLLPDFNCVACNEITDACVCLAMNGLCYYNQQIGCFSNPCSAVEESTCRQSTDRCEFVGKQCKLRCSKLKQDDCNTRAKLNECNWDTDLGICLTGAKEEITINTIASLITEQAYSTLIGVVFIIHMIL